LTIHPPGVVFGIMALEAVFVQVRTVFPPTARIIFLSIPLDAIGAHPALQAIYLLIRPRFACMHVITSPHSLIRSSLET
jgi:hypothetical protein